jgi:competence protein ComEC
LSSVASYDTKAFNNFKKYTEAQGKSIEIPTLGEEIELGSSHVKILGPITFDEENVNNCSIVVKVIYGETSFLFTGDMEREEENEILEYWGENELSSTVLKVGHHGSETSTSYVFLRAVEPSYAVISVGTDNSYGHPSDNVLSRLRDADVQVYRTDLQGDIVITSNGKDIGIETEKNEKGNQNGDTTNVSNKNNEQSDYIGNTKSHKFHLNSCKSLPLEKNRVYFENREDAVNAGYEPCGNCKP